MFVEVITGTTGNPDVMRRLTTDWVADISPGTTGWRGTTAGVTADGTFIAMTEIDSATARIPGHDRWRTATLAMLDGDPSSLVYDRITLRELPGDAATAGFVQFGLRQVPNRAELEQYFKDFDAACAGLRPDCVGRLMASCDDGRFVGAFDFSSEADARAAEAQEMAPELADLIQRGQALSVGPGTHIDLTTPWIYRSSLAMA
jgi:hypothetical protein